jgi:hypothetical protein
VVAHKGNQMKKLALAGLLAAAVHVAAPQTASALTYVMMTDERLLQQAEGVSRVTVLEILPSRDGDRETLYRVRVDHVLVGRSQGAETLMALPGTFNAPNLNLVIEGVPQLLENQTYLVFHSRRADGVLLAQQLSLGVFGLVPGDTPTYVRYLDDANEANPSAQSQRHHLPRHAKRFERWIRSYAAGELLAPDYFLDANRAKHTFTPFNFSTPGPGRWFQFDSSQTLQWTAASGGQTGAVTNVFTALSTALAAWTNDPGSRILLAYSGTAASAQSCPSPFTGPSCFSGHVKWNDPDNQIPGTFDCGSGGVLGIGGSSAYSAGQTFAGQTWYPRILAFVTVQDNAACALDGSGGLNWAEFLAHEAGHAIGFGHSCGDANSPSCGSNSTLNAAIMRATLHGNRGAVLGVDDIAGAAVIYPDPTAGGGAPCSGVCIFRNGFD